MPVTAPLVPNVLRFGISSTGLYYAITWHSGERCTAHSPNATRKASQRLTTRQVTSTLKWQRARQLGFLPTSKNGHRTCEALAYNLQATESFKELIQLNTSTNNAEVLLATDARIMPNGLQFARAP